MNEKEKCPVCGVEMVDLGLWPDYSVDEKVKQVFVCHKCQPLGKPPVTVRREVAA